VCVDQWMWYLLTLSSAPSTSSAVKTPQNTEENLADPDLADEGDIQTEYSSH